MKLMSLLKEDVSKYTNADISKFAVAIASLTATKPDAVQKFVDTNELNIEKLYQFLKRSKLDAKMDFVTALVGKPNNPIQKKMIKMFSESVNEAKVFVHNEKTGEKYEVLSGKGKGDLLIAMKALEKSAPSHMKYSIKESVNEETELPKVTVPASVKAKLDMAIDKIKDTKLSYNQKLNVVVSVMDSLGIDKSEFGKMASKLKGSMEEISVNEADVVNRQLNVKVNKMLQRELGDLTKGGPNHQFAIMHILMGALTDANFHSDSKKVPALFGSKAKYEGDPMAEKDLIQMYEYDLGPNIAALAKWDGKDIVNAIGFYVSMTVGRPMGEKIEKLVEGKK